MKPYRKNAGAVVFNRAGLVLVGERLRPAGCLQFPQGGLNPEEDPLTGARRELFEETGLRLDDPPAGEIADWLRYEFPPGLSYKLDKFRGQEQKWFFFAWNGALTELSLDHDTQEFSRIVWADFRGVVEHVVPFKRGVYEELYRHGTRIIENHSW